MYDVSLLHHSLFITYCINCKHKLSPSMSGFARGDCEAGDNRYFAGLEMVLSGN